MRILFYSSPYDKLMSADSGTIIVLGILCLVGAFIFQRRRRGRGRQISKKLIQVTGKQVVAELAPDMPWDCLRDHGLQFGEDFKHKDSPSIPHSKDCRCRTIDFVYNSDEVYNGALRKLIEAHSHIDALGGKLAYKLLEVVRETEGLDKDKRKLSPLDYYQKLDWDAVPSAAESKVKYFIEQRCLAYNQSIVSQSKLGN